MYPTTRFSFLPLSTCDCTWLYLDQKLNINERTLNTAQQQGQTNCIQHTCSVLTANYFFCFEYPSIYYYNSVESTTISSFISIQYLNKRHVSCFFEIWMPVSQKSLFFFSNKFEYFFPMNVVQINLFLTNITKKTVHFLGRVTFTSIYLTAFYH